MKLELRRVTVDAPGAANARRQWQTRTSVRLRLIDASGRAGVGEASPLPGYSPDTVDDAEAALKALRGAAVERAIDRELVLERLSAAGALLPASLPAARFALEMAALDLIGHVERRSAPELLGADPLSKRALCALVGSATDESLRRRASEAASAGYRAVKVKVGAPSRLADELAAVVDLRQRLGPAVALRLDANGTLGQTELDLALPALKRAQIELFEEPGASTRGSVPLALDESLQGLDEGGAEAQILRTGAAAIVLKPTALGGLCHCRALAERARRAGAAAVISHCFDGPWAFRAAAALALSLGEGMPHGLAPHAALAEWPIVAASCVRGGRLEGWSEPGLGLDGGFE